MQTLLSSIALVSFFGAVDEPKFLTESTVLWKDRVAVVAMQLSEPAAAEQTWDVISTSPGVVAVLGQATVLAGETTAYVRVEGLEQGAAELRLGGDTLGVKVAAPVAAAPDRSGTPTIVAPAIGSCVWGTVAVGVELQPGFHQGDVTVELHVPGIGTVTPVREVERGRGPERRFLFEFSADDVPAGPLTLKATAQAGPEAESDRWESDALCVVVVRAKDVLHIEVEDTIDAPRPEGFDQRPPAIVGDDAASGGRATVSRGYQGSPVVHVDLERAGQYQAMVRVRGDLGAGAFPTLALAVGGPNDYRASTRVLDRKWHRVPLGGPIALEAGESDLMLRLTNVVQVGRNESRDLYLDSIELLRVDALGGAGGDSMMAMSSMEGAATMTSGGQAADIGGELWVGLHNVVDGLPMTGQLRLEGLVSWTGQGSVPVPTTTLLVDGEAIASIQSDEPIFLLSPGQLGEGEHQISLRADQPGRETKETVRQTLHVPAGVAKVDVAAEMRLGSLDERWRVTDGPLASPPGAVTASMDLPEELSGTFDVLVDARGPGAPHHRLVSVRVEGEGTDDPPMELKVQNWWNERLAGSIAVTPGAKRLVVSASAPESDVDGADLLRIRSVILRPKAERDVQPPRCRIVYPAAGQRIGGLDAVVVEAVDDVALKGAELLVDGRPVMAFGRIPAGAGRVVLPLDSSPMTWSRSARRSGEHELSVRVLDTSGHQADSPPVTVEFVGEGDDASNAFERAVYLTRRLGYGPSTQDLAALLTLGEEKWLDLVLADTAGDAAATELARASVGDKIPYGATQLALRAGLTSGNAVRSRFAFFVDNHFSTWAGKTGVPSEYGDHRRYQALGFAPFAELLRTAVTSPVLLSYLDQPLSFRGRVNENFARELLELHTVGVNGGYAQEDVERLARLLTGLTVAEEAPASGSGQYRARVFRYAPDLADAAGGDLLGMRFAPLDDEERAGYGRIEWIVAHLAAHPMTARFVCTKLAEHYVACPPPADLVDDLADVFLTTGGDSAMLLRCIAQHPRFFEAAATPRMATPFDFAMTLGRATVPRHVHGALDEYMKSAGMGLFDHIAPDGYSNDDADYLDSNAMLARWSVAQRFPWAARYLAPEELRRSLGDGDDAWKHRVIDHAGFALFAGRLSEPSREAALTFLDECSADPHWKRADALTLLMTRLPEASAR